MFLSGSTSGYNRDEEQWVKGPFLIVFSHNEFKWERETGRPFKDFPKELQKKLYAYVANVRMSPLGNYMMGIAKIGNHKESVSGAYGGDGLPRDYENIPAAERKKLVELPPDLTAKFWAGGGHNSAGSEAGAMKKWAEETFKKKLKR